MVTDNFIIPPFKKKKGNRLNILLELSELRKKQNQKGQKIGELRKQLIEEKEGLKAISEKINIVLDSLIK
jgi:hypothetical protein